MTPERALVERAKAFLKNEDGRLGDTYSIMAAFAAEYAREQVGISDRDHYAKFSKVHDKVLAELDAAQSALTAARQREEEAKGEIERLKTHVPCQAHTPSLPLPPATCCHVGDTITFWDEKFCDAVNEDEKIIDALRAENDRLTLAASESARTLQVEIERLRVWMSALKEQVATLRQQYENSQRTVGEVTRAYEDLENQVTALREAHPHEAVKAFHEAFGVALGGSWRLPSRRALRQRLIVEEYKEWHAAEVADDPAETLDAIVDLVYVLVGAALEYGMDFAGAFAAVHAANMAKLGADGKPIIREDGKVLKPAGWKPADLSPYLAALPQDGA